MTTMSPTPYLEQNTAPRDIAVIVLLAVLATFAVVGRFASRKLKKLEWASDDWTAVAALLLAWISCAIPIVCYKIGIGRHIEAVPPENLVRFKKILYAWNLFYDPTPPMIKISLLLLYKRVFTNRKFHTAVNVVGGFTVIWCLAFFTKSIWNCVPIRGFWDTSVHARCLNFTSSTIAYAVVNIFTDIVVLALPGPVIWRLQLSTPRKVALTLIFMLGSFDTIAALIRLLSAATHDSDPDVTWVYGKTVLWSSLEMSVGVIGICLPTLQPIVSYIFPKHSPFRLHRSTAGTSTTERGMLSFRKWPYTTRRSHETIDDGLTLDGYSTQDGEPTIPSLTAVKVGGRDEVKLADQTIHYGIQVQHDVDVRSMSY